MRKTALIQSKFAESYGRFGPVEAVSLPPLLHKRRQDPKRFNKVIVETIPYGYVNKLGWPTRRYEGLDLGGQETRLWCVTAAGRAVSDRRF